MLAAVVATLLATPAPAAAVSQTLVCTGTVTETFTPALPAARVAGVTVSMSTSAPLSCTGPSASSVGLSFNAGALTEATCAGPLALLGSGQLSFSSPPGFTTTVTWLAGGTPQAQEWTFFATDGPAVALGAAVQVPPALTSCVPSGSIAAVTLTALVVIVA